VSASETETFDLPRHQVLIGGRSRHQLNTEMPVATDQIVPPEAAGLIVRLRESIPLSGAPQPQRLRIRNRTRDCPPPGEPADFRGNELKDLDRLYARPQLVSSRDLDELAVVGDTRAHQ